MITQALSYSPVDRTTPPRPRTGKGGLRPIDFLRLIDARLMCPPQAKRASQSAENLLHHHRPYRLTTERKRRLPGPIRLDLGVLRQRQNPSLRPLGMNSFPSLPFELFLRSVSGLLLGLPQGTPASRRSTAVALAHQARAPRLRSASWTRSIYKAKEVNRA